MRKRPSTNRLRGQSIDKYPKSPNRGPRSTHPHKYVPTHPLPLPGLIDRFRPSHLPTPSLGRSNDVSSPVLAQSNRSIDWLYVKSTPIDPNRFPAHQTHTLLLRAIRALLSDPVFDRFARLSNPRARPPRTIATPQSLLCALQPTSGRRSIDWASCGRYGLAKPVRARPIIIR